MKHTLVILFASVAVACGQAPNISSIKLVSIVNTEYCWTTFAGDGAAQGCAEGTGTEARFTQLYGCDINGAGDTLFVADRTCSQLSKITIPSGVVTHLFSGPSFVMIAVNKTNGNLYFPDLNDGAIKKLVPPDYANATTVAAGPGFGNGLAVDSAADTVYASKTGDNQIYKIENAGLGSPGPATLFAGNGTAATVDGTGLTTACSINAPMSGCVVGTGSSAILYWASRVPGSIRKIDIAAVSMTTVAGGTAGCNDGTGTAAQFDQPHNVVIGPDGNLYIDDQTSGTVRKCTLPDAVVTTIGGVCQAFTATDGCGANATFGQLGQITIDNSGTIWGGDRGVPPNARARVVQGVPMTTSGPGVQIDFTAGATDTAGDFTLQSSSTVNGTYADVAATITQEGPAGSFRAVIAPGGDIQFYRIKR